MYEIASILINQSDDTAKAADSFFDAAKKSVLARMAYYDSLAARFA